MTEDAKKKRKNKNKITHSIGFGDPVLNKNKFNDGCLTATSDEHASVSNAISAAEVSSGGMSMGAGNSSMCMGEKLILDEKRETKRYYARPQNIFMANKDDVLKVLVDAANAGTNCSIYSLKNLDDHENVGALTNKDIIYYFDNNALYDKNKVPVVDYQLGIKNEEERPNFGKNPDSITKSEFDKYYDDRMTKETVVESVESDKLTESLTIDGFKLAVEKGEEMSLGYNEDDADQWISFEDGEPYSHTEYFLSKDNDKYILSKAYISASGEEQDETFAEFDDIDKALDEIKSIKLENCPFEKSIEELLSKDILTQKFDNWSLKEKFEKFDEDNNVDDDYCVICGEEIIGYGNNAEPVKEGRCCDACNLKFVIPARLR